jgi:hypothetical protein
MTDQQKQIENLRKLGLSEEEIADVLTSDKEIDKGAKLFELTDEQKKVAKKMSNAGERKKPTTYKLDNTANKRKKENPTKGGIIAELAQFLTENSAFAFENVEIVNKERQISMIFDGNTYELTLSQKRKPKN